MRKLILHALLPLLLPFSTVAQPISPPTNLRGQLSQESKIIHLTWNRPDIDVAGYSLFVKTSGRPDFYLWGKAGLIYDTEYDYELATKTGDFYEFKMRAVNNFPEVTSSDFSNAIIVEVPSSYLPMVNIGKPKIKKKTAALTWSYTTSATDFQGFILLLDGEEIVIKKEVRTHVFNNLSSGKHIVQLVAFTTMGLRSELSNKKFILIK